MVVACSAEVGQEINDKVNEDRAIEVCLRRVQTTTSPGVCSNSLKRSQARHDCSRGSEPVTWISYNFCTRLLLLYDVISDVVFTNLLR